MRLCGVDRIHPGVARRAHGVGCDSAGSIASIGGHVGYLSPASFERTSTEPRIAKMWGERVVLPVDVCDPRGPIAQMWCERAVLQVDVCDLRGPIAQMWCERVVLPVDVCDLRGPIAQMWCERVVLPVDVCDLRGPIAQMWCERVVLPMDVCDLPAPLASGTTCSDSARFARCAAPRGLRLRVSTSPGVGGARLERLRPDLLRRTPSRRSPPARPVQTPLASLAARP